MVKRKNIIDLSEFDDNIAEEVKWFIDSLLALKKNNSKLYVPLKWKYYKDDINWLNFPKLVFTSWCRELWLHIIVRSNGSGMWYIFKQLKTLYMAQWLDAYTASKKANDNIDMFYTACDQLSLEGKPPFISYICYYDRQKKEKLQS